MRGEEQGEGTRANLASFLSCALSHTLSLLSLRQNTDPAADKVTRGAYRAAVERALGAAAAAAAAGPTTATTAAPPPASPSPPLPPLPPPAVVIVDGLCDVSGFRYELWCAARSVGAAAAVTVVVPGQAAGVEKLGGGTRVVPAAATTAAAAAAAAAAAPSPYGPPALAASLASRFETPDPANRWERPLFVVATGPAGAAGLPPAGGAAWGDVDWASTAPAPPAAPAGARAVNARATQLDVGWPLVAVAAGVAAFVLGSGSGGREQQQAAAVVAETEEGGPPPRPPSSLTPGISTSAARASGADELAALDATLQRVVVAVAGHGGGGPLALDPTTGSAVAEEAAGRGWGEGDGGEGPPTATVTLALPRRPALAELRRHKRDFLRALSGPLAALPANGPAAVRAFVAHLGRAVRDR